MQGRVLEQARVLALGPAQVQERPQVQEPVLRAVQALGLVPAQVRELVLEQARVRVPRPAQVWA